jgi:cytochrome b561
MQLKNTTIRYGAINISLHWLMALIIIGMLILGLYMTGVPKSLWKLKLYGWHKEFGILILMLAALRIAWRLSNIVPLLPGPMPQWQKLAARSVHFAFYIFMLAMPLTGWMMSSAAGVPVSFFGLFIMPDLVAPNKELREILAQTHTWLAYGLIAAICAHVGAALQHEFWYKDGILRRMLP